MKPFSRKGSHLPAKPPASPTFHPEIPRRSPPEIPGIAPRRPDLGLAGDGDTKRLFIARDICLSGEITSCDRLVVEGRTEVSLPHARIIEIAPSGFFKGSADVEEADISGRFEGELIVRDRLVVRAGGRINGTIRYGRIVIESGGEISGDMQTLESPCEAETPEEGEEPPEAALPEAPKRKRGGSKSPAEKK
ncbi:MAG: polymer-forming cytoskeletal protein [Proteobacteria bacterium]|nr:polymer-forming cytoskeletal protein [Pseudomonadota bacterium]